jgi:hypothetical protein
MKIAVFVTGSARTIQLECTLRRTIDNVVMPLGAEVYFSVNVPIRSQLHRIREHIHNTTHRRVVVAYNDIYVDDGRYVQTANCRPSIGRQQLEGMARCMRAMEASHKVYEYVIRTRTDLYVPFRLHSLPVIRPSQRLVAYLGFVGGRCNDRRAWWVDDRFAILATIEVQRAYFYGFVNEICESSCSDSSCNAPECKLGSALAKHGVAAVDLRDIAPTANLQIVRGNCIKETTGLHWIRPSFRGPILLTAHNLSALRPKK